MARNSKRLPKVNLHPTSVKYLKQGHPWVTEDDFTKKFPPSKYLVGVDRNKKEVAFLLHDKNHKKIKARLWSNKEDFPKNEAQFLTQLYTRLEDSFNRRLESDICDKRENYYLVFGEADFLPGLQILAVGNTLFFIYYAFYWKTFEQQLLKYTQKLIPNRFDIIISQERNKAQESKRSILYKTKGHDASQTTCKEFGINYSINTKDFYDMGLYTDMSSIREKLLPTLKKSKSVLNLYSYTGAFSLYALANGATNVHSVDLSAKYLDWLDYNLRQNEQLNLEHHTRVESSVEKALQKYKSDNEKFDLIICDPPTFSSDGRSASKAIKNYEVLIEKIDAVLEPGGTAVLFLNTHTLNRNQFNKKIEVILTSLKLDKSWRLERALRLSSDCPQMRGFPEGDYLKGLVFNKL